ncbi:MAG: response regulator [Chitinophagaceae bacterium]
MIKTLLIDDEPLARSVVKEYLAEYPEFRIMQECRDGFEGIKAINEHQPEIIFLDIQMPKINGFEMLELIEEPPAVIFTTAYDEYAMRAFETSAVDYLLKPFSKERFNKAIHKWKSMQSNTSISPAAVALIENAAESPSQRQRVVVKTGGKIRIIPVQDIAFLEAADDFVKIHPLDGSSHLKNKTMQYFEKVLPEQQFVRVHRSYILNIHQITRIELVSKDNYVAILKSSAQIPLSRTGYGRLREVLGM